MKEKQTKLEIKKCPKCKKTPILYTEYWRDHSIEFEVNPDGTPKEKGYMGSGQEPYCVLALCLCGYQWRLRNVYQISDLRNESFEVGG